MNSSHQAALDDSSEELQPTADSRAEALNRLREAENERLGEERDVRKRLVWARYRRRSSRRTLDRLHGYPNHHRRCWCWGFRLQVLPTELR